MDLGVRFRDTELALGIAFDLRDGEALEDEAFSRGSGMPSDFASLARDPLDDLLAVERKAKEAAAKAEAERKSKEQRLRPNVRLRRLRATGKLVSTEFRLR